MPSSPARGRTGGRVKVIADKHALSRAPDQGDTLRVVGEVREHPRYGPQLHAGQVSLVRPATRLIVDYLGKSAAMAGTGVGMQRARQLYERFGDALADRLDEGDVAALGEVVGEEKAQVLVERWQEHQSEARVVAWLERRGLEARLARRVLRVWGEHAVERLEDNPYRLLVLLGWRAADGVARQLGVPFDDPRRLVGAVEASLYAHHDQGHTCIDTATLEQRLGRLLPTGAVERAVQGALDDRIMTETPTGYQHLGMAYLEAEVASRLRRIAATPPRLSGGQDLKRLLAGVLQAQQRATGLTLNAEQISAVRTACTEPLSLLLGGAGVGKTTVLQTVHAALARCGRKVVQCALAGRAANRLREVTGREAYTIAALLHGLAEGQITVPPDSLVVVDEASMLDLAGSYRLLEALPEGVSLLLVGDPYQLPPIGFGLVFHVLAELERVPKVELTRVHRQVASTGIPQVAKQLRHGRLPDLPPFASQVQGVYLVPCEDDALLGEVIRLWAALCRAQPPQGPQRSLPPQPPQVLSPVKGGPAGLRAINQALHERQAGDRVSLHGKYAVGDPVVHLTNDYAQDLYNGSLGMITAVRASREPGVQVRWDGVQQTLVSAEELTTRLDLAYAITVHKAQGSQFPKVILPITRSRVLDRTLVYTAVTRATELVVVVGDKAVLQSAVTELPRAHGRQVRLDRGFNL